MMRESRPHAPLGAPSSHFSFETDMRMPIFIISVTMLRFGAIAVRVCVAVVVWGRCLLMVMVTELLTALSSSAQSVNYFWHAMKLLPSQRHRARKRSLSIFLYCPPFITPK